MLQRLMNHWVYGGFLAGLLLLALTPILIGGHSPAIIAIYLLLPAYMIHQFEEHDRDRFRQFFNATIGKGQEVLSPAAVFITNVPGVWGVIAIALALAIKVQIGWGLLAVYLVLVNAVVHIAHGILFRSYNPGLATAIAIFIPLGTAALLLINSQGSTPLHHVIGIGSAILIHLAIIIHVKRRAATLL